MKSIYEIQLPAEVVVEGKIATATRWSKNGKQLLLERAAKRWWEDIADVEPYEKPKS